MERYPSILEINTSVWLNDLGRTLDTLAPHDIEPLAGRDYLWLMGAWERSAAGQTIARALPGLVSEYRAALPDYTPDDVVGSAYAIRSYRVDGHLGSEAGLAAARRLINERLGAGLILDFVPNHCAIDAPWVLDNPELFVPCEHRPAAECFRVDRHLVAHGRDPYFAPWTDTAQYDFANPATRQRLIEELLSVADRCDGVRCDMAMLMLREVFTRTWQRDPQVEFWAEAIATVKARHPGFVFIAEAYWGLEWQLMQLGFDFCYDKTLYDRLTHHDARAVSAHLRAERHYSDRLVRFAENHDEQPARRAFGAQWWAATFVAATVPGAHLEYLGQGERTVRLPVQLGREPRPEADPQARHFLRQLAAFRRTLSDEFEVFPCPHPQVLAYRRGRHQFLVNIGTQGVQLSVDGTVLRLSAGAATVVQADAVAIPVDWLRQVALAA